MYAIRSYYGYEHIDLVKAKELGMGVSHVTYDPDVVADYAIMLLMMNLRKMPFIVEQAKVQNYSLMGKIGKNIGDCTIGVIGTGKIGQTVIRHLYGFGCRIRITSYNVCYTKLLRICS